MRILLFAFLFSLVLNRRPQRGYATLVGDHPVQRVIGQDIGRISPAPAYL
jgi:hypothetical protein